MRKPKVSIGLPVYNGEKYVGDALRSLLAQTFADFEIIISDNCSTDSTPAICRQFMEHDSRISYFRHEKNLGPVRNFNGIVERAQGKYFKWAPADDTYDPQFLERCVEILDKDPSVVLCQSQTRTIDAEGRPIGEYVPDLRTESPRAHIRFHDLLRNYLCYEIFGVMRTEVLRQTPLLGSFGHADGVLLARLGLYGKIALIREYLYFNRHHPEKSLNQYSNYRDYTVWLDPSKAGKILLPRWRMGWEYARAVFEVPLPAVERILCFAQMGSWAGRFWKSLAANLIHAFGEVIGVKIA